jgi:hypothetical protein
MRCPFFWARARAILLKDRPVRRFRFLYLFFGSPTESSGITAEVFLRFGMGSIL